MDINVNANDWQGISAEDKRKITEILDRSFKEQHTIVPSAGVDSDQVQVKGICTWGCNKAQELAEHLCNRLSGTAKSVCLVAAQAAGDLCRKKC